ncbi:MAG: SH3 domain-containing protein, partial [Anaerolineae bacterium]|nr:SH3 domain-containing protein [Thermoflexales bacterium]MDW8408814.1 SH3 domain-containing protein [Anaerolineae bacterium]
SRLRSTVAVIGVGGAAMVCLLAAVALLTRPTARPIAGAGDILVMTATPGLRTEADGINTGAGLPFGPTPPQAGQVTLSAPPTPTDPSAVLVEPSVTSAPPTAISPQLPQAVLKAGNEFVNVRAGPALTFNKLGEVKPGQRVTVRGKTADGLWWQISWPDAPNGTGWVYADYLDLAGDVNNLPVVK